MRLSLMPGSTSSAYCVTTGPSWMRATFTPMPKCASVSRIRWPLAVRSICAALDSGASASRSRAAAPSCARSASSAASRPSSRRGPPRQVRLLLLLELLVDGVATPRLAGRSQLATGDRGRGAQRDPRPAVPLDAGALAPHDDRRLVVSSWLPLSRSRTRSISPAAASPTGIASRVSPRSRAAAARTCGGIGLLAIDPVPVREVGGDEVADRHVEVQEQADDRSRMSTIQAPALPRAPRAAASRPPKRSAAHPPRSMASAPPPTRGGTCRGAPARRRRRRWRPSSARLASSSSTASRRSRPARAGEGDPPPEHGREHVVPRAHDRPRIRREQGDDADDCEARGRARGPRAGSGR